MIESSNIEEYLEEMYRIKEKREEITVSRLARVLKISKASVSEMLRKMSDKGLVKIEKYGEIELTKKGELLGKTILRKHRLIEKFLRFLGVKHKSIHIEACKLEHYISDDIEKRLAKLIYKENTCRLSEAKEGKKVKVVAVEASCNATKRLADLGLTVGTRVTVQKTAPFGGPIKVCVRNSCFAIGKNLANKIIVGEEDEKK